MRRKLGVVGRHQPRLVNAKRSCAVAPMRVAFITFDQAATRLRGNANAARPRPIKRAVLGSGTFEIMTSSSIAPKLSPPRLAKTRLALVALATVMSNVNV